MRVARITAVFLVAACGGSSGGGDDQPPDDGGGADPDGPPAVAAACDPLPLTGTPVIPVSPADAASLGQIVLDAPAGAIIELADGVYPVGGGGVVMNLSKPLTLTSASRDPAAVVLDGGDGYAAREIIQITSSGVTVAHLTIQNAQDHLIHLYPGGQEDLSDVTIHDVVLIDAGQQFVKANANEPNSGFLDAEFVDDVTVSCSTFTMTAAGRAYVPINPDNAGYPCYTGGIDAHAARGWHVVRNTFAGIYCDGGLAEHAIHFWHSGRDQLIEQNVVGNCARGIGLGMYWGEDFVERPYADDPHAGDKVDVYVGNYDGIVRNNVVWADVAAFDSGISLEQAIGARVHHNTVFVGGDALGYPIEYRWPNSIVEIRNNLAGLIVVRDGASGVIGPNYPPQADDFVGGGDYHLAGPSSTGVDRGEVIPEAGLDLDGETHDRGPPDLGADEMQ